MTIKVIIHTLMQKSINKKVKIILKSYHPEITATNILVIILSDTFLSVFVLTYKYLFINES